MSRRSSNNVRVEGFFGTLKSEFFYSRDWRGVAAEEFMAELDARLRWFRSGGISQALGWLTPDEHRLACGYVVAWLERVAVYRKSSAVPGPLPKSLFVRVGCQKRGSRVQEFFDTCTRRKPIFGSGPMRAPEPCDQEWRQSL